MNSLDAILLFILLVGAFFGYRKGLLMEIIAIFGFVLAVIGGLKLVHVGVEWLRMYWADAGGWLPYLVFVMIFLTILVGIHLLGKLIKKIMDFTIIGSFDGLAGAIIGLFKWAFGLSLIVWISITVGITLPQEWVQEAVIFPYIEGLAPNVVNAASSLLPYTENILDTVKEMFQNELP